MVFETVMAHCTFSYSLTCSFIHAYRPSLEEFDLQNVKKAERKARHKLEKQRKNVKKQKRKKEKKYEHMKMIIKMTRENDSLLY